MDYNEENTNVYLIEVFVLFNELIFIQNFL